MYYGVYPFLDIISDRIWSLKLFSKKSLFTLPPYKIKWSLPNLLCCEIKLVYALLLWGGRRDTGQVVDKNFICCLAYLKFHSIFLCPNFKEQHLVLCELRCYRRQRRCPVVTSNVSIHVFVFFILPGRTIVEQ